MAYIEDQNLMAGEVVIYRAKLHPIIFGWPIAWLCLFATTMGAENPASVFFLLLAILSGVSALIAVKTSEFGVTNKRVMIKVGFIRRVSLETLLAKVEGVTVEQGLLGRLFGYGTITVIGTGSTRTPFKRIAGPMEFRRVVQEQIETANNSRAATA